MYIAVSGSSGLVGSALLPQLSLAGHRVTTLVRGQRGADQVPWDPQRGILDQQGMQGVQGVVHLAGENIAAGRWTKARKERIRDSRVLGTQHLCRSLVELPAPPSVLVSASAIGYYGDRGDERLTDEAPRGEGFLADVTEQWEQATEAAARAGVRVVLLRLGMILSPRGGALAKMLTPFRLGLGGVVGSGRQYWSWIALEDVVGVIQHALLTESLAGAVNAVAPQPVTNREFTSVLARTLRRPALVPLPAWGARLALGEMADALLLASARVEPQRLLASGYQFQHPTAEGALRSQLKGDRE